MSAMPMKSGCGPVDWFQTHNVPYTRLAFRQWVWIAWHYVMCVAVAFAALTWAQESDLIDTSGTLDGWKGVISLFVGLVYYWLFPHRMYHFFGEAPYAHRSPDLPFVAGLADASSFTADNGKKYTTTVVSSEEGHFRVAVPYPQLKKPGILPDWFEIENVPYTYLYYRQWVWIIYHYSVSFATCFALLSWFQEATVLESEDTFKGWKGAFACGLGLVHYWLMPHRMYGYHENAPNSD